MSWIAKEIKTVIASAPGKIILSGEHAVVYEKPAILAALNRRLSVSLNPASATEVVISENPELAKFALNFGLKALGEPQEKLKLEIFSTISVGCGMGSSAALAAAITAALFKYLNRPFGKKKVNEIAHEIERKQHGNPSGGDNTVSFYGGFLWYRKETEFLKIFKTLRFRSAKLPRFVLINTGRPLETTGEMVADVRKLYDQNKSQTEKILERTEKVTKKVLLALMAFNQKQLIEAIKENEKLLEELGVVSPLAEEIVKEIEKAGGAAKISGAGGKRKGSGILLSFHREKEILWEIAKKRNLDAFEVKLGKEGVKIERS